MVVIGCIDFLYTQVFGGYRDRMHVLWRLISAYVCVTDNQSMNAIKD